MAKRINNILFRCVDCTEKYSVGDNFPHTKLEIDGMQNLSDKDRAYVFQQLAVNLGTFCEFIYGKYGLEVKKAEIEIEIEEAPQEKAYEA